ncbi:MAG: hypothetical protein MPK62_14895, partial [Alphaproteobacteria bacterium]|nr:hypothetical protein [Alphaproteobacteria bacterium]
MDCLSSGIAIESKRVIILVAQCSPTELGVQTLKCSVTELHPVLEVLCHTLSLEKKILMFLNPPGQVSVGSVILMYATLVQPPVVFPQCVRFIAQY